MFLLPFHHLVVDVVVGGEFGALSGTGGDGTLKVAVVDAGCESAHELRQISRRAQEAPRVIGAGIRGDGRAGASRLGELIEILTAAGTNMKGVRFFADDGKETELSAEPHGLVEFGSVRSITSSDGLGMVVDPAAKHVHEFISER